MPSATVISVMIAVRLWCMYQVLLFLTATQSSAMFPPSPDNDPLAGLVLLTQLPPRNRGQPCPQKPATRRRATVKGPARAMYYCIPCADAGTDPIFGCNNGRCMNGHLYCSHSDEAGVGYTTISKSRQDLIGLTNNPHKTELPTIQVAPTSCAYMKYDTDTPWAKEVYGCPVRSTQRMQHCIAGAAPTVTMNPLCAHRVPHNRRASWARWHQWRTRSSVQSM